MDVALKIMGKFGKTWIESVFPSGIQRWSNESDT